MAIDLAVPRAFRLLRLPAERRGVLKVALVGGVVLLPFLFYARFFNEPFQNDEGTYAAIARGLLHGQLPYRDYFDHKAPLVYAAYALSFLIFGTNVVAPRILAALCWSATSLLVYVEGRLVFDRRVALTAAALASLGSGLMVLQANANTEVFMLLPLTASLVAFSRWLRTGATRWLPVAGAAGAAAVLTKQVAATQVVALGLVLAWTCRADLRRLFVATVAFGGAGLGVLTLVLVPFALGHALGDFYYATVTYNGIYSSVLTLSQRVHLGLIESALFVLVATPFVGFSLLALVDRRTGASRFDGLHVVGLLAAMGGVCLSGYFLVHYYVALLPFLALTAAPALTRIVMAPREKPAFTLLAGLAFAICLVLNLPPYLAGSPDARHDAKFAALSAARENESRSLAAYVDQIAGPDDLIYNWGRDTEVYFYANRRAPTRFFYDRSFWLDPPTLPRALADLEANKPAVIIDSLPPAYSPDLPKFHPPAFEAFLNANYDFVAHVDFADIYRLRTQ